MIPAELRPLGQGCLQPLRLPWQPCCPGKKEPSSYSAPGCCLPGALQLDGSFLPGQHTSGQHFTVCKGVAPSEAEADIEL